MNRENLLGNIYTHIYKIKQCAAELQRYLQVKVDEPSSVQDDHT